MLLIDSFRLYHLVFPVRDRFHSPSAGGEVANDGMSAFRRGGFLSRLRLHCSHLVTCPSFSSHHESLDLGSGKSIHPRQANDASQVATTY
jgi:hypothetical protein